MPEPIPPGPFDQGLFLTHFNKGRELFKARRLEEAERELEEAYLLRPRDVRVLNLLGLVYFRQNKLEKAEEVYRKLVTENPEAHTLHYNLGLICIKLNRLEDAESAFLKALELTRENPKINFYLGSIYERTHRYKDAIYQYRQAGAHLMVQRVEGKMSGPAVPGPSPPGPPPEAPATPPPPRDAPAPPPAERPRPDTRPPGPVHDPQTDETVATARVVVPVNPSLMSGPEPGSRAPLKVHRPDTARFKVFADTLPPGSRRVPSFASSPEEPSPPTPPSPQPTAATAPGSRLEAFRCLEGGLMEVDFSGKVFIKQGTIYTYSGNLTFWVKEKRPEGQPSLVIVTGTGRLILTDRYREITLMRVDQETVFVEPSHLLACEEGLEPRYVRFGEAPGGVEVVALEGSGMVALSVATKPLPLTVRAGLPVSVPASSVIMWSGDLVPAIVDDPQVYEVVMPAASRGDRLLRLDGEGRILAEQASS
jgi:uncharacterized protein (AIM24 family)